MVASPEIWGALTAESVHGIQKQITISRGQGDRGAPNAIVSLVRNNVDDLGRGVFACPTLLEGNQLF